MSDASLSFNYFEWFTSFFTPTKETSPGTRTLTSKKSTIVVQPFRKIEYEHFHIIYSTYHKAPLAVYEMLNKEIISGDAQRKKSPDFFTDVNLEKRFANEKRHFKQSEAFENFNFAKGHMAAAANYGKQPKMNETFTYANIIPQNQNNNSGIWSTFERYSRDLLNRNICQSVEIISGPIYSKTTPYKTKLKVQGPEIKIFMQNFTILGVDGIVVPDKLYKIIKCNQKNRSYASGFVFFNSQIVGANSQKLISFERPINEIQDQTGLLFNLSQSQETKPLQSLMRIDQTELNKTKQQNNKEYIQQKIKKDQSLNELMGHFQRTKEKQLNIKSRALKQKTLKAKQTSCSYLYSLLNLNQQLCQLELINDYQQMLKNISPEVIRQCKKSATQAEMNSLKQIISAKRWYKYVNQQLLNLNFNQGKQANQKNENK